MTDVLYEVKRLDTTVSGGGRGREKAYYETYAPQALPAKLRFGGTQYKAIGHTSNGNNRPARTKVPDPKTPPPRHSILVIENGRRRWERT